MLRLFFVSLVFFVGDYFLRYWSTQHYRETVVCYLPVILYLYEKVIVLLCGVIFTTMQTNAQTGKAPKAVLNHIAVYVADLKTSTAFY